MSDKILEILTEHHVDKHLSTMDFAELRDDLEQLMTSKS